MPRARRDDIPTFKSTIDFYSQKYGFPTTQPERGLEAFAAHLFAMEEGFDALLDGGPTTDADLAELIMRGNDLGIDAVLEDEENKALILVQASWVNKTLSEDKLNSFFAKPDLLRDPAYVAKGGDQAIDLLGSFADKIDDGWDISLRFVTNKKVGEDNRLRAAVEAANRAYEDRGLPVSCELFGETDLQNKQAELQASVQGASVPEASFSVARDRMLAVGSPDMPYETLICVVKATALVDLYNRDNVGNRLFNLNIRLPLASRRINPQIQKTATEASEAGHFFYYNNGISAVCSEFSVADTTVTAKRLQIINGAQTVYSLVKAKKEKKLRPETLVLMRLTATRENYGGQFTDRVIAFNNTQNPVKASDFFSNDPLHKSLQTAFSLRAGRAAVPKFDYVYKSGMVASRGHKALKSEDVANVRHAFLFGPTTSYREPKTFFDPGSDGRYGEAFGVDKKRVDHWSDEEIARFCVAYAITRRVMDVARTLKADPRSKSTKEAKYLYRSARYIAALVGVGLEEVRDDEFKDYVTLAGSKAQFDKYVDPLLLRARDSFENAIEPRYREAQQPEYNFLRDDSEWASLSQRMREAVNTGRVRFT